MKKLIESIILLFTVGVIFSFAQEPIKSAEDLERKANQLYTSKDAVLYNLDSGMLSYYEGDYTSAINKLSVAETLIDEYYTKSVSQFAASLMTNDNVIEYPGEDYEDIYTNLFKTLAYYKIGKWEEGFHEINAFKRKANALKNRHEIELLQARQAVKGNTSVNPKVSFYNSALGEYLSLLYFKSIKDQNQAAFSSRMLKDVFDNSGSIYDFPYPSCVEEELSVTSSDTRLNFVVLSGTSPYKRENLEFYSENTMIALPELVIPEEIVKFVTVKALNKQTGKGYVKNLSKIEDFGNICKDIYKTRSSLIYAKTVARAASKNSLAAGTGITGSILSESDNTSIAVLGNLFSATSTLSENNAIDTEKADLRHSSYFPGRADVGGFSLEPGIYDITVAYYSGVNENPIYFDVIQDFTVKKGKLNLVSTSSTLIELKNFTKEKSKSEIKQAENKSYSVHDFTEEDQKFFFDIGTEPESDSSSTYGLVQYDWTNNFSSNLKMSYTSSTQTENEVEGYTNGTKVIKNKEFSFIILPCMYRFEKFMDFTVSLGGSYQFINENTFAGMFDTNGYILKDEDIGKYFTYASDRTGHIIAPRIGFNAKKQFNNMFAGKFDFYINPILFININQNINYKSNQTTESFDYSGSSNTGKLSSPYIETKLSVDILNCIRPLIQFSYQNLKLNQLDWADDGISFIPVDDTQEITKLKIGFEVMAGKKQKAKVRGGVYYQINWNKSSYTGETVKKDKWIFGIGSEL